MTATPSAHDKKMREDPVWIRGIDRLTTVAGAVAGVFVVLMAVNILIDVTGRSLFNRSLPSTLELVAFFWMPGISMLALGLAQFRNEQIRVTLLNENTSPATQRILEIVAEIFAALLFAWMSALSFGGFQKSLRVGEVTDGVLAIPLWPGHLLIAVGLAIAVLAAIARAARLLMGAPVGLGEADEEGVVVE